MELFESVGEDFFCRISDVLEVKKAIASNDKIALVVLTKNTQNTIFYDGEEDRDLDYLSLKEKLEKL